MKDLLKLIDKITFSTRQINTFRGHISRANVEFDGKGDRINPKINPEDDNSPRRSEELAQQKTNILLETVRDILNNDETHTLQDLLNQQDINLSSYFENSFISKEELDEAIKEKCLPNEEIAREITQKIKYPDNLEANHNERLTRLRPILTEITQIDTELDVVEKEREERVAALFKLLPQEIQTFFSAFDKEIERLYQQKYGRLDNIRPEEFIPLISTALTKESVIYSRQINKLNDLIGILQEFFPKDEKLQSKISGLYSNLSLLYATYSFTTGFFKNLHPYAVFYNLGEGKTEVAVVETITKNLVDYIKNFPKTSKYRFLSAPDKDDDFEKFDEIHQFLLDIVPPDFQPFFEEILRNLLEEGAKYLNDPKVTKTDDQAFEKNLKVLGYFYHACKEKQAANIALGFQDKAIELAARAYRVKQEVTIEEQRGYVDEAEELKEKAEGLIEDAQAAQQLADDLKTKNKDFFKDPFGSKTKEEINEFVKAQNDTLKTAAEGRLSKHREIKAQIGNAIHIFSCFLGVGLVIGAVNKWATGRFLLFNTNSLKKIDQATEGYSDIKPLTSVPSKGLVPE